MITSEEQQQNVNQQLSSNSIQASLKANLSINYCRNERPELDCDPTPAPATSSNQTELNLVF